MIFELLRLIPLAARNLARNRLRTGLTLAGVAVAVVAFVLLRTLVWAWTAQVQDAANLGVTSRFTSELERIILKDPAVQDLGVVNGFSFIDGQQNNSAAVMFGLLKPFDERKDPSLLSFDTLKRLNAQFFARKDGVAFAVNPPSIPGLGTTGGFEFYIQNRGSGDPRVTEAAVQAFLDKRPPRFR